MSVFVLVHGAYHGGWCFATLAAELERRGHRALAPDLPCDDPAAGFDRYVAVVLGAMDRAGVEARDCVLLGHSLGGFTAPLVAERRSVARLVFLCTAPVFGAGRAEALRARMVTPEFSAIPIFHDEAGRALMAPADARRAFYQDCDAASADWAVARLRPQGPRPLREPWPLERWPPAARSVVLTRDDRALAIDAGIEAARFILDGADPIVLEGGHSPFLSRPAELADVLVALGRETVAQ